MNSVQFAIWMEELVDRKRKNDEWYMAVNKAFPMACDAIYEHDYEDMIVDMLRDLMDDKEEWIPYFLYESDCCWFEIEVDNVPMMIDSYDDLYHLIARDLY